VYNKYAVKSKKQTHKTKILKLKKEFKKDKNRQSEISAVYTK